MKKPGGAGFDHTISAAFTVEQRIREYATGIEIHHFPSLAIFIRHFADWIGIGSPRKAPFRAVEVWH